MNKYIERNIEEKIVALAESFPVVMITGPRQVGKTTLLNHLVKEKFKNVNYVTFDNMRDRMLAIEDPELFLDNYPAPLIIDEFQYAPNLLSYIKMIVDKKRLEGLQSKEKTNGLYFLTGSQSFLSMEDVSESLAGRVGIIDLYGLSLREINNRKANLFIPNIEYFKSQEKQNLTEKQLFEIIFKGSYPEIYKDNKMDLSAFYESYIRTYIERDIRMLINVKEELKFRKFMVSVAVRTGEELNLNEIARDVEISNPTASEWLSILVNTGLVFLLEPFSNNIIKRVVKRPKLYFMDTGLASYLAKYPNSEILRESSYAGHIFETFVVSEIIKSFTNNGLNASNYLYYYRDNNDREIDLIIDYNNKLYPIEIKKGKNPNSSIINNFKVLDETKRDRGTGLVICMINEVYPIDCNNWYVPVYLI